MEAHQIDFIQNLDFSIWENPSKMNGYECTGAMFMRTADACMFSSISTISALDLPKTDEELVVFITKLKSKIDVLEQALSLAYTLLHYSK